MVQRERRSKPANPRANDRYLFGCHAKQKAKETSLAKSLIVAMHFFSALVLFLRFECHGRNRTCIQTL